jgi:hypothetical protein
VPNAGDAKQVKGRKKLHKFQKQEDDENLKFVLGHPRSRAVLWSILEEAGIYKTCFSGDNNLTNFHEGKREVGLRLLTRIFEVDLNAFMIMSQEAAARVESQKTAQVSRDTGLTTEEEEG